MSAVPSSSSVPPLIRFFDTKLNSSAATIHCGDWEVAAGEAWFVAGGLGAGKTSFLRVLAGLEQPQAGRIERFGDDWASISESETVRNRRRMGVVLFRDAGLFHRSTVLENVRLPLDYHGGRSKEEIHERVHRLLAALDLTQHADTPSFRLNQASVRRALLARSLALDPEVLLLDDPCAGLDEWERRQIIQFIRRLHAGHEVNAGRPMTLIITGGSPAGWREFPALKLALLRGGELAIAHNWEQLVASAPELFHDPDAGPPPN